VQRYTDSAPLLAGVHNTPAGRKRKKKQPGRTVADLNPAARKVLPAFVLSKLVRHWPILYEFYDK
jgi:hypothetical protein